MPVYQVKESRLEELLSRLTASSRWPPAMLSALRTFICSAEDYDLFRVNPLQYAKRAGISESDAIDLFIHAAKVGLFEMDWQLLCAYCPQVAGSFRELENVHPRFQCEFCNANNDVALDDYIQVTFTIAASVRDIVYRHPEELPVEAYYLQYHFAKNFIPPGGMTPEQLLALLSRKFIDVEAHEEYTFECDVTAGRFEVLDLSHNQLLVLFADGDPDEPRQTRIELEDGRFQVPDRYIGPRDLMLGEGSFSFRQTTDIRPGKHSTRIINLMDERGRFWIIQYPPGFEPHPVEYEPFLSGKKLLLTPAFRELYKTQIISEGEGLNVTDMTYLFTDLKGSTPLYDAVGDVNAYMMVRQHFEILNAAVRKHSGIVVKTIGDAIMGAFEQPVDAVNAGIEMVEELARYNETVSRPLSLKVGIHRGRAIAVALNERIDYFGQDVNIAARIQTLAEGNELCITQAIIESAGVVELLKDHTVSSDYVAVRGVGEKVQIHRVPVA